MNRLVDSSGNKTFNIHDAQGSVKLITNAAGTIVKSYSYYPFDFAQGKPFGDSLSFTGSFSNDLRYTEQRYVDGLDAYDYNARYYDPKLGRFYAMDPIYNPAISPYAYCNNDPVNYTDPTGMKTAIERPNFGYLDWEAMGGHERRHAAGGGGLQYVELKVVIVDNVIAVHEDGTTTTEKVTYEGITGYFYYTSALQDASGEFFNDRYTARYMAGESAYGSMSAGATMASQNGYDAFSEVCRLMMDAEFSRPLAKGYDVCMGPLGAGILGVFLYGLEQTAEWGYSAYLNAKLAKYVDDTWPKSSSPEMDAKSAQMKYDFLTKETGMMGMHWEKMWELWKGHMAPTPTPGKQPIPYPDL